MINVEQWAADLIRSKPPFVAKGRDRDGLDCWGLCVLGHKELFNRDIPSFDEYYDHKDVHYTEDNRSFDVLRELIASQLPNWDEIPLGKEQAGDIVILRLRGQPIHAAMVYKKGWFVHIDDRIEVCSESLNETLWRNRIVTIRRHRV